MSDEQADRLRENKAVLKHVIIQIEHFLGPLGALPICMPIVQAIDEIDAMFRKSLTRNP